MSTWSKSGSQKRPSYQGENNTQSADVEIRFAGVMRLMDDKTVETLKYDIYYLNEELSVTVL